MSDTVRQWTAILLVTGVIIVMALVFGEGPGN